MTTALEGLSLPEATTADVFLDKLYSMGGVVEEMLYADEVRSPSVQLRLTPTADLEIVSTHDQILGGPTGQSYSGCRFPADVAYREQIQDYALAIGRKLRDRGVVSRFAVDFVVARGGSKPWRALAIEINLRMGGTTVPFLALQFLTAGSLDPNSGEFLTPSGERRFYRATDGLASPAYHGLLPEDLIELLHRSDLGYSPDRRTGVLFHMLGALSEHGKVGVTAIGNSSEDTESLFRGVVEMLDHETSAANSSVATQRREKTLRLSME